MWGAEGGAARAVARRTFADARWRTAAFAALFALVALANVVGYRQSYPTFQDRLGFAAFVDANKSVRLFFGTPYDPLTAGGYVAWRAGGLLVIFAAVWGVLTTVRALRGEEDSGRREVVLAGAVSRGGAFAAVLGAVAAGTVALWAAVLAGLLAARLSPGGSAYLALAVVTPVPVFVGVGALASQLLPTRRLALEASTAVLGAALVLRVAADTSPGLGALRWAGPFGWAEELRPFAGPRPLVLLLPLTATVVLLGAAAAVAVRRDVGRGVVEVGDRAEPRLRLLGSPTAQALRGERATLAAWVLGTGGFALVLGVISAGISSAGLSSALQERLRRIGGVEILTPQGYLSFVFLIFVLVVSLFACAQVATARREEAEGRLDTLLVLPVSRRRWLCGRLALAGAGAGAVALVAGVLAWAGAAAKGAGVSLPAMIGAGANCLPAALLFLGVTTLVLAFAPRLTAGLGYGLVSAAFVWELLGAVLGAPGWMLALSPFHHVGLVPAQPFRPLETAVMLGVAALTLAAGVAAFERRDLAGL